eukprot:m.171338 g.171338  ORF g.171338 m.171338 type:complete len:1899 (-) comp15349_c2_seq3:120-5816(-)
MANRVQNYRFDEAQRKNFALLDRDNDGKVDASEFREMADGIVLPRSIALERFNRLDMNKDGSVEVEEYLKSMRDHVLGRYGIMGTFFKITRDLATEKLGTDQWSRGVPRAEQLGEAYFRDINFPRLNTEMPEDVQLNTELLQGAPFAARFNGRLGLRTRRKRTWYQRMCTKDRPPLFQLGLTCTGGVAQFSFQEGDDLQPIRAFGNQRWVSGPLRFDLKEPITRSFRLDYLRLQEQGGVTLEYRLYEEPDSDIDSSDSDEDEKEDGGWQVVPWHMFLEPGDAQNIALDDFEASAKDMEKMLVRHLLATRRLLELHVQRMPFVNAKMYPIGSRKMTEKETEEIDDLYTNITTTPLLAARVRLLLLILLYIDTAVVLLDEVTDVLVIRNIYADAQWNLFIAAVVGMGLVLLVRIYTLFRMRKYIDFNRHWFKFLLTAFWYLIEPKSGIALLSYTYIKRKKERRADALAEEQESEASRVEATRLNMDQAKSEAYCELGMVVFEDLFELIIQLIYLDYKRREAGERNFFKAVDSALLVSIIATLVHVFRELAEARFTFIALPATSRIIPTMIKLSNSVTWNSFKRKVKKMVSYSDGVNPPSTKASSRYFQQDLRMVIVNVPATAKDISEILSSFGNLRILRLSAEAHADWQQKDWQTVSDAVDLMYLKPDVPRLREFIVNGVRTGHAILALADLAVQKSRTHGDLHIRAGRPAYMITRLAKDDVIQFNLKAAMTDHDKNLLELKEIMIILEGLPQLCGWDANDDHRKMVLKTINFSGIPLKLETAEFLASMLPLHLTILGSPFVATLLKLRRPDLDTLTLLDLEATGPYRNMQPTSEEIGVIAGKLEEHVHLYQLNVFEMALTGEDAKRLALAAKKRRWKGALERDTRHLKEATLVKNQIIPELMSFWQAKTDKQGRKSSQAKQRWRRATELSDDSENKPALSELDMDAAIEGAGASENDELDSSDDEVEQLFANADLSSQLNQMPQELETVPPLVCSNGPGHEMVWTDKGGYTAWSCDECDKNASESGTAFRYHCKICSEDYCKSCSIKRLKSPWFHGYIQGSDLANAMIRLDNLDETLTSIVLSGELSVEVVEYLTSLFEQYAAKGIAKPQGSQASIEAGEAVKITGRENRNVRLVWNQFVDQATRAGFLVKVHDPFTSVTQEVLQKFSQVLKFTSTTERDRKQKQSWWCCKPFFDDDEEMHNLDMKEVRTTKISPPHILFLGDRLLAKNGNMHQTEHILDHKFVGIYFSCKDAENSGYYKDFRKKINAVSKRLKNRRKDFEFVYVSTDNNEDGFKEMVEDVSFYSVPFHKKSLRNTLNSKYMVGGRGPTVVMLSQDGKILNKDASLDIMDEWEMGMKTTTRFPWHAAQDRDNEVMRVLRTASLKCGKEELPGDIVLQGKKYVALLFGSVRSRLFTDFNRKVAGIYNECMLDPRIANDFEIIFMSTESDEELYNYPITHNTDGATAAEMIWPTMPFRSREYQTKIANLLEIPPMTESHSLPKFWLFKSDDGGNTFSTWNSRGLEAVLAKKSYPWPPDEKKGINAILLNSEIVKSSDDNGAPLVLSQDEIKQQVVSQEYLVLYFGATWSEGSERLLHGTDSSPSLLDMYQNFALHKYPTVSVAFEASTKDFDRHVNHIATANWFAVARKENVARMELDRLYGIKTVPTMIILGPNDQHNHRDVMAVLRGNHLSMALKRDPEGTLFPLRSPWAPSEIVTLSEAFEHFNQPLENRADSLAYICVMAELLTDKAVRQMQDHVLEALATEENLIEQMIPEVTRDVLHVGYCIASKDDPYADELRKALAYDLGQKPIPKPQLVGLLVDSASTEVQLLLPQDPDVVTVSSVRVFMEQIKYTNRTSSARIRKKTVQIAAKPRMSRFRFSRKRVTKDFVSFDNEETMEA